MLGDAASMLIPKWHLVVFPGVAIVITVLAFNQLGDGLRDAFDPRLRGTNPLAPGLFTQDSRIIRAYLISSLFGENRGCSTTPQHKNTPFLRREPTLRLLGAPSSSSADRPPVPKRVVQSLYSLYQTPATDAIGQRRDGDKNERRVMGSGLVLCITSRLPFGSISLDRAGAARGPRHRRRRAGWILGPRTDSGQWRRACRALRGWTAHRFDQLAVGVRRQAWRTQRTEGRDQSGRGQMAESVRRQANTTEQLTECRVNGSIGQLGDWASREDREESRESGKRGRLTVGAQKRSHSSSLRPACLMIERITGTGTSPGWIGTVTPRPSGCT